MKNLKYLMLLSLFFASSAMAINVINKPTGSSGDASSHESSSRSGSPELEGQDLDGSKTGSCDKQTVNIGDQTLDFSSGLTYGFLSSLMINPRDFSVDYKEENGRIRIVYPGMYSVPGCLQPKYSLKHKNDNNLYLRSFNGKESTLGTVSTYISTILGSTTLEAMPAGPEKNYLTTLQTADAIDPDDDTTKNGNGHARMIACMIAKGVISKNGQNFDASKAKLSGAKYQDYYPKNFDKEKDSNFYFLSPNPKEKFGGDGAVHKDYVMKKSFSCYNVEKIHSEGTVVYKSPESQAEERTAALCKEMKYTDILNEIKDLDPNTLGNYKQLKGILEGALDEARKKRRDEIYEKMASIEQKFIPDEDDRKEGRDVGVTEKQAKKLTKEYASLAKELDKIEINPLIGKVKGLLEEREDADEDRQAAIDKQVRMLNDRIGKFGDKDQNDIGYIYNGMKEYGLTEPGWTIEGYFRKSRYYKRYYSDDDESDGRGKALDLEDISKVMTKRLKSFKNSVLTDWRDYATVKKGGTAPLRTSQKDVAKAHKALNAGWSSYQKKEQKDGRKYCGRSFIGSVNNPVGCKRWQQGRNKRLKIALAKRKRGLLYIKGRDAKFVQLRGAYGDYQSRKIAAEIESGANDPDPLSIYTPGGGSFSYDFEDDYNEDYDFYPLGGSAYYGGSAGGSVGGGNQFALGMQGANPFAINSQQMIGGVPGVFQQQQGFGQQFGQRGGAPIGSPFYRGF